MSKWKEYKGSSKLGKKKGLTRKVRSGHISVFGNNTRRRRACQLQQRQQAPGWSESRTEVERVVVVAVATKRLTFCVSGREF